MVTSAMRAAAQRMFGPLKSGGYRWEGDVLTHADGSRIRFVKRDGRWVDEVWEDGRWIDNWEGRGELGPKEER